MMGLSGTSLKYVVLSGGAVAIGSSDSFKDLPGVTEVHHILSTAVIFWNLLLLLNTSNSSRDLQGAVIPAPLFPLCWVPQAAGMVKPVTFALPYK